MRFEKISINDKKQIQKMSALATKIVKEHFDPIIGVAQNDYMIQQFQTPSAISKQIFHGYQYYFVLDEQHQTVGFLAYAIRENELYLSKFYLIKEVRGKGFSRDMLQFLCAKAKEHQLAFIVLNVNRNNSAIAVYEKLGFYKIREEVNEIGNGYVMDDFVYSYQVNKEVSVL